VLSPDIVIPGETGAVTVTAIVFEVAGLFETVPSLDVIIQ
jgi:hypothetical protein